MVLLSMLLWLVLMLYPDGWTGMTETFAFSLVMQQVP
jgi:hypothetical protein